MKGMQSNYECPTSAIVASHMSSTVIWDLKPAHEGGFKCACVLIKANGFDVGTAGWKWQCWQRCPVVLMPLYCILNTLSQALLPCPFNENVVITDATMSNVNILCFSPIAPAALLFCWWPCIAGKAPPWQCYNATQKGPLCHWDPRGLQRRK